jgi:two-component system nitrate/nitrite response regulator NarL
VKILLCDDHLLLSEALATLLRKAGHDVLLASSPDEAVLVARDTSPDVCVLDLGFPDGTGLDVLSHIGAASPTTRVLMLSGSRDPDLVAAAMQLGASGYICKDVGVLQVIRAVDRVHEGEMVLDPALVQHLARRPKVDPQSVDWLLSFLTNREHEVLRRITLGQTTGELARDMLITRSTARTHVQNVLQKLGVHSRLQAVALVSQRRDDALSGRTVPLALRKSN